MKKVALISDGWKRLITYAWVDGIMNYIHRSGEEVCLCQYNCQGNWSKDRLYNHAEYNIYSLPDLKTFDGIILDCNNISDRAELERLIEILRDSRLPVVSIGYDIPDFYYAGIDNRRPIMEMMEHLYERHGCRRFVFAGGPKDNFENTARAEAYLDSLRKYGLTEEDNPVWHGDYDFQTGVRYFEEFMQEEKAFPDVFVCANDNIAAGLCFKAEEYGYNVPRDFKVTGFDNLDKAIYFNPQITTVGQLREDIGGRCMEILMKIWNQETVPKLTYIPTECIFTESCGCPNSGLLNYRDYARNQIITGVEKLKNEERLVELESALASSVSFDEIFIRICEYFKGLECDGFYIAADERLYSAEDNESFPIEGYELERLKAFYTEEGQEGLVQSNAKALLKRVEENGSGNSYMFTPLHFRERAVGFTILKNGRFLYNNPYFYDIIATFLKTMEDLYQKLRLKKAYTKLRDIYNRDQLTGLYNRIAYSEMVGPAYKAYCQVGEKCAVTFSDADYFKEINDNFGHDKGDEILKRIADTLLENTPKDGYVYRFGGDEFVAFFPCTDEKDADAFRKTVTARLAEEGISISMGIAVTNPESGKEFEEYLRIADNDMYERKKSKR